MDKLKKLLEYVSEEEDMRYGFAMDMFKKNNQTAYLIHQAEASAFQRVRYAIEQLMEESIN